MFICLSPLFSVCLEAHSMMFPNLPSFVDKILDASVVIILFLGCMAMFVPFGIEYRHHLLLGEYLGKLSVIIFADVEPFTLIFQMFFESFFKLFVCRPVNACDVMAGLWAFRTAFLQLFEVRLVHWLEPGCRPVVKHEPAGYSFDFHFDTFADIFRTALFALHGVVLCPCL